MKRVFMIVLDSVGVGETPDARLFGGEGSNTLLAVSKSPYFNMPNLDALGFFGIRGLESLKHTSNPKPSLVCRIAERSMGKDSTIGHWEIAGLVSQQPLPVFPEGFPNELLDRIREATGRDILCNRPYSGTQVIADYGVEHMETGALIVYTSADSVLQIAAHEDVVPLEELYDICRKVRKICVGPWAVGRVIARPFIGQEGSFTRTANRHDFSFEPPAPTVLDAIRAAGKTVLAVGKIGDLFGGRGMDESRPTQSNAEGIELTIENTKRSFEGLSFTNLVDFDMLYGHRNDVDGYAKALAAFDQRLPEILESLTDEDLLIITADHGNDPSTPSTDHSREFIPFFAYNKRMKKTVNLGERETFSDIAATVAEYLGVDYECPGTSMMKYFAETLYTKDELLAHADHTLLDPAATWDQIRDIIDDAIHYHTASICIPPAYVKPAYEYLQEKTPVRICTVIGFPNGYNTTAVKVYETAQAVAEGADEIDMVIHPGMVKAGHYDQVLDEIRQIKAACNGKLLKVIIETCLLTEEEKKEMCRVVTEAGADYIKTSTGFSSGGATFADVKLMAEHVGPNVKIKAAGGISSFADAAYFTYLGADRLGTSRLVKIMKGEQSHETY